MPVGGGLEEWAGRFGRRSVAGLSRGCLRFAFYGRVSTEDWQDPGSSLVRQREQAEALVRGHGVIVTEFFDVGESRSVAWGRRPQAAALVAQLADPGRGWGAIVVGEYERAFYGSRYALMAPLFEHYTVQLWLPEAGGLCRACTAGPRPWAPGRRVPADGRSARQVASSAATGHRS
jgi:site-specific DNA recombinase